MSKRPASPRLSISDVAEERGLSESTVRRLISRGDLRAYRIGKRIIRIDPADLDALFTEVNPATYAIVGGGAS
ncbi:helix-turn-helix domain-containing protein [Citricoccus parietis]|uniref:Helix-turn-helix domain-containing protein n=1 Tax=Citricoccus parietis TaxID=592307 RepID=A0ABV6F6N3_9MICC